MQHTLIFIETIRNHVLKVQRSVTAVKEKMTKKERLAEKKLDKGIVWAKILTVIALVGLIVFTIISLKF